MVKKRGVIVRILGRFVGPRVKRQLSEEQSVIARDQQKPRD
jgi:hypothetical protein